MLDESQKQDRVEQRYASGAKLIKFQNGTTKLVSQTGFTNIRFENGDLKRINQDKTVVYFYFDVGTLFTQL